MTVNTVCQALAGHFPHIPFRYAEHGSPNVVRAPKRRPRTPLELENPNRHDLTGMTFGRLTVESITWGRRPTMCQCRCVCGKRPMVRACHLSEGRTRSCGCFRVNREPK